MQLKTVCIAPWPHCLNINVFSNRLNWPYDTPHSWRLGGRLFKTCDPAVANCIASDWRVFKRRQNAVVWHGRRRRPDSRQPGNLGHCRTNTVDDSCNPEHDVLPHGRPVQLAEHTWDMITLAGARHEPGRSILNWLQAALQFLSGAIAQCITVVWATGNKDLDHCLHGVFPQVPDNRPKLSKERQLSINTPKSWAVSWTRMAYTGWQEGHGGHIEPGEQPLRAQPHNLFWPGSNGDDLLSAMPLRPPCMLRAGQLQTWHRRLSYWWSESLCLATTRDSSAVYKMYNNGPSTEPARRKEHTVSPTVYRCKRSAECSQTGMSRFS